VKYGNASKRERSAKSACGSSGSLWSPVAKKEGRRTTILSAGAKHQEGKAMTRRLQEGTEKEAEGGR